MSTKAIQILCVMGVTGGLGQSITSRLLGTPPEAWVSLTQGHDRQSCTRNQGQAWGNRTGSFHAASRTWHNLKRTCPARRELPSYTPSGSDSSHSPGCMHWRRRPQLTDCLYSGVYAMLVLKSTFQSLRSGRRFKDPSPHSPVGLFPIPRCACSPVSLCLP